MRLKTMEKVLLTAFLAFFTFCVFSVSAKNSVSDKLIRLHVKANSDSAFDQELKLKVRDAVINIMKKDIKGKDIETVKSEITAMLPEIKKTAEDTVNSSDADYGVKAALERHYFPTREYADFALPSGDYETLYIELGEAKGKNWWCVLFPPLCIAASEGETIENTAESSGFSNGDVSFITGETSGYKIKFKIAEVYGDLKHRIFH
ncbi:MAG: stage II sporulation protein R [Bacillota bacterium]|nr:stage II sporulation protein R [Bacillota bacterium]